MAFLLGVFSFWPLSGREAAGRPPFFGLDPCCVQRSPQPLFKGQGEHHAESVSPAAFVMELKVGGFFETLSVCLSVRPVRALNPAVMAAVLTRPLNLELLDQAAR